MHKFSMGTLGLDKSTCVNDFGTLVAYNLNMSQECEAAIKWARPILGCLRRSI